MKFPHVLVALLLAAAGPAFSATVPSLSASPESKLWLSGDSTLHPYASTSTLTQIEISWAPDVVQTSTASWSEILAEAAHRAPFKQFKVTVPVKGLKSGETRLDKNMHEALKMATSPEIQFTLSHYAASPPSPEGTIPFQASGQLTIAGVAKDIDLNGSARITREAIFADGAYTLKMSDYGIKPPKLLMGTLRVADPVVVHFHLMFQLAAKGVSQ